MTPEAPHIAGGHSSTSPFPPSPIGTNHGGRRRTTVTHCLLFPTSKASPEGQHGQWDQKLVRGPRGPSKGHQQVQPMSFQWCAWAKKGPDNLEKGSDKNLLLANFIPIIFLRVCSNVCLIIFLNCPYPPKRGSVGVQYNINK